MRKLVQRGQRDRALLLVRVRAGEHGEGGLGGGRVRGQVGNAAGDVDEVPRSGDELLLELVAEPERELPLKNVGGRLVVGVEVCATSRARRRRRQLEAQASRGGRARR